MNYANSPGPAAKVVDEIKLIGSDAVAIQADVSDVEQTVRLFDEAVKVFGKLDIACSNSGVVSFGHLEEVTPVSPSDRAESMLPQQLLTSVIGRV